MLSDNAILRTQMIGRRIREARLKRGLTQAQLAALLPGERAGKPRVCRYEKGTRRPSLEDLILIADALGVTLCHLIGVRCDEKRR
jgi:transcriptional regulator with XRE-family HTH domain